MRRPSILVALLASLLSAGAWAEPVRYGTPAGTLYELRSGTPGELVLSAEGLPEGTVVLALDQYQADLAAHRRLVPASAGFLAGSEPVLIGAPGGGVRLLWIDSEPQGFRLLTATFSGEAFSEPEELLQFGTSAPRTVVLRDQYRALEGAEPRPLRERTTLHLFWWDESASLPALRYAPVVVVDGSAVQSGAAIDLAQLDESPTPNFVGLNRQQVLSTLALHVDAEARRAALSFANPRTGRLLFYDLQLLPGELGELANKARGHIIEWGTILGGDRHAELADSTRARVLELGAPMSVAATRLAGDEVRALIAASPAEESPNQIAQKARGHIIEWVAPPVRGGMVEEGQALAAALIEIQESLSAAPQSTSHLLRARLLGLRLAPLSLPGEFAVLVSPRATAALLAWQEQGEVRYRESADGELWSDVKSLQLGTMSWSEAKDLLQARLSGR